MKWLGVGYRGELRDWLFGQPAEVKSLEITAEHFFDGGDDVLRDLSAIYPLFVHGLGLSLGTPGRLCEQTLDNFARVADMADAQWVSEHVSFTRSKEVDLGHLNPVLMNEASLSVLVDHAIEVAQRCNRPLVLENVTSSLQMAGDFSETDFLNQLCQRAGCGLLLDVTNLFINSKNHGYEASAWLREIDTNNIRQLHVVGYTLKNGRYHDHHSAPIQPDLMELVAEVLECCDVDAVTLERDERLDAIDEIRAELHRLECLSVG